MVGYPCVVDRNDEVLQAIRAAQEARLAELSYRLGLEHERRVHRQAHVARIRSLQPIIRTFLSFMAANGNPGAQRFLRQYVISPETYFRSPRYGTTRRGAPRGWPLAVVVHWWPEAPLAPHPSEPRAIIALDVNGNWWKGNAIEGHPSTVTRPVELDALDEDEGYCSAQCWERPYVSIDQAVIKSIAEVCAKGQFDWRELVSR
jgi:hypothetical protein